MIKGTNVGAEVLGGGARGMRVGSSMAAAGGRGAGNLNQIDLLGGEGIVGEGRGTMEEQFERGSRARGVL